MNNENEILESWRVNAQNWIETIDGKELESRTLITNKAILDAVLQYNPDNVIDIGCGEGWLTRELRSNGIDATGVDGVEPLVLNAIKKGGNHYFTYTYVDIINGKCELINSVDAAVINFALLDEALSAQLIAFLSGALKKGGNIFIQTLHPLTIALNDNYESGWKDGSWNGLKREFVNEYKWYFRTLEDWTKLFIKERLSISGLREPLHPLTKKPASIIFELTVQ